MSQEVITTHSLHFSFNKRQILFDINLKVPEGSIFGFLGPNGAGKTTTIKTLLGLLRAAPGMIRIFGEEFHLNRLKILEKTGAMVEAPSLYEHLSAERNIEITRTLRNACKTQQKPKISTERTHEVLEIVGLSADKKRPVKQFSTGMKQRLSLAISILDRPKLLILDEPINGLDPTGIIEIRHLLEKLRQEEHCTIFLSSHILSEIEKLCTDVAVIHKGRLLYQGSTRQLLDKQVLSKTVNLEVDQVTNAVSLLKDFQPELHANQISIRCMDKQDVARAVAILAGADVAIYRVAAAEHDLEASFLQLING